MASSSASIRAALPQRRPGYRHRRCASYFDHDKFKFFTLVSHHRRRWDDPNKDPECVWIGEAIDEKSARFAMNCR